MVLIRTKPPVLTCPRADKTVSTLDCRACEFFKHFSLVSFTVFVACRYGEKNPDEPENLSKEKP